MSESTVTVLFFAGARDAAGVASAEVAVDAGGTTVANVAETIAARFPSLAPFVPSVRFAVNGTYARLDEPVRPGDEVAVIPPVAGG